MIFLAGMALAELVSAILSVKSGYEVITNNDPDVVKKSVEVFLFSAAASFVIGVSMAILILVIFTLKGLET